MRSAPARTLRALPTLLRIGVAETVAYRAEFLVWILTTTQPLIMLGLWTRVAREAPFARYSSANFVAYFLACLIVRQLTGNWVAWQMSEEVRSGAMAMRLLRPLHPFFAYAASHAAAIPFRSIIALPVAFVLLASSGASVLSTDPVQLVLAVIGDPGVEEACLVDRLWRQEYFRVVADQLELLRETAGGTGDLHGHDRLRGTPAADTLNAILGRGVVPERSSPPLPFQLEIAIADDVPPYARCIQGESVGRRALGRRVAHVLVTQPDQAAGEQHQNRDQAQPPASAARPRGRRIVGVRSGRRFRAAWLVLGGWAGHPCTD
jgi:hypothetical protein